MTRKGHALPDLIDGSVLVIGDVIVDIYHSGKPLGISAETPTLVVGHEHTKVSLGGAGFLVRNMLALGGTVSFVTLIGTDDNARHIKHFSHKQLTLIAIEDASRPTTVKERFWSGEHKLLAWDTFDNSPLSPELGQKVLAHVRDLIEHSERLVVSDYRHGLLTEELAEELVAIAKKANKALYVDSQVAQRSSNHLWYKGADLFCLNAKEAKGIDTHFTDDQASLRRLQKTLGAKHLILKRGEKGSASLVDGAFIETPAYAASVKDTIGAGDAFLAMLALCAGLGKAELIAANTWAGLKTEHFGTQTPELSALTKAL
jgi:rfaE bifunctional protein kinase chain/domain